MALLDTAVAQVRLVICCSPGSPPDVGSRQFAMGGPSPGTWLEALPVLAPEMLAGILVAATPVP